MTVHVEHVMGMAVSIDVADPPLGLLDEIVAWLHHVDRVFSPYLQDSVVTRLGRGEVDPVTVTDEVLDVLLRCDDLRTETGGVFDPWKVPTVNGTTFDPSGFVKGWAVERAAAIVDRAGVRDCCINAGGDVALRGERAPGRPWRVGIRHPDQPAQVVAVVEASGPFAVATSATYERGSHILDPRTGEATTEFASATVVGPDLATADAYATTLFVLGVDGLDWLGTVGGGAYGGYVVTHDGDGWSNDEFERHRRR
jgi:thiamine biosynthesis lipoprotein